MFSSDASRAAAYRNASVDTLAHQASPHQLIVMLFEGLLQSVHAAHGALQRGHIPDKCRHIGKAVRILEEGLKASLDVKRGGPLAENLANLYDYCVRRLTVANVRNDGTIMQEVASLIAPVADGWSQIGGPKAALLIAEPTPNINPLQPSLGTALRAARQASLAASCAYGA